MTLRKKINTVYMISIVIPLIIFMVSLVIITGIIRDSYSKNFSEIVAEKQVYSSELIASTLEEIILSDENLLSDEIFLKVYNDSLKSASFLIELYQDSTLLFSAPENIRDKTTLEFYNDHTIIKDGVNYDYKLFTINRKTKTSLLGKRRFSEYYPSLILFFIVYLILHVIFIKYAMKHILDPLNKMKEASNHIKDGNLDYSLIYETEDEVGDVFRTFDEMRLQLKHSQMIQHQYDTNRKELLSNISHDLRTPITAINGYVQGIIDGVANTDEKLANYVNTISCYVKDMDNLIEDLFLFSKLDLQSVPFDFESVDVVEYITDCIEEYSFDFDQRAIKISQHINYQSDLSVTLDRRQIKRVINNIVYNAINHFGEDIPHIDFMLSEDQENCIISITDNGIGIPEDKLELIFHRFFKVDESRSNSNGSSGLGLSISKHIVEAHSGKIWATSEVDKGTTISFSLKKVAHGGHINEENSNY